MSQFDKIANALGYTRTEEVDSLKYQNSVLERELQESRDKIDDLQKVDDKPVARISEDAIERVGQAIEDIRALFKKESKYRKPHEFKKAKAAMEFLAEQWERILKAID